MRKIKFRAWDKRKNKMTHVVSIRWKYGRSEVPHINGYLNRFVLLQYTGLKDKNGKEIYEGDIVKCWKKHSHTDFKKKSLPMVEGYGYAIIRCDGWSFSFQRIKADYKWFFYDQEGRSFYPDNELQTMEVISNIYENKLLKKE